LLQMIDSQDM